MKMPDVTTTTIMGGGFGVIDYGVFVTMLLVSLGIGVFHALKGNRNPEEYLMGGRSMTAVPVAVSLLSSFISAISILGNSGEAYAHGTQLSMMLIGALIGILLAGYLFLPVFYPLKLTSINEYIDLRFRSPGLRLTALVLNTLIGLIYSGLCLYAPTLALSSVTPISVETYIVILGVICTLYSTIGGLKAVVWTDVFQMGVVIVGVVVIIAVTCVEVGGFQQVWSISQEHGRIQFFDLGVSIYQRHNLANVLTMGTIMYLSVYGVSQANLQRVCSVPSLASAKRVLYINIIGMVICSGLLFFCGLCAFATYAGCDPLSLGYIYTKDQILPYFVMDRLGFIYGMPGLFVATLFSGALSSLSSIINSVVAMLWIDVLEPLSCFRNVTKRGAATINKGISCLIGAVVIGVAFFAKRFSGLIQAAITITSVMGGPMLGMFLLGVLVPRCDHRGAIVGLVTAAMIVSWIAMGASCYGSPPQYLPFSTDTCSAHGNSSSFKNSSDSDFVSNFTNIVNDIVPFTVLPDNESTWTEDLEQSDVTTLISEDVLSTVRSLPTTASPQDVIISHNVTETHERSPWMAIYGISYTLYPLLGVTICFLVGIFVTVVTGGNNTKSIPPELVAPMVRRFLPLPHLSAKDALYTPVVTCSSK